jgi:hypothetical protein
MKHIIHITSDFEKLKSILCSNSLRLNYCKEDFYLGNKKVSSAAHPMICFSEYDISTINNQVITYGKFGIAFTRGWVEQHKIHPVLYIDKNSLIADSLAKLLVARRKNATKQLAPRVRLAIMMIKCFTKNARGYNSFLDIPDFDFKSENEWRYVPAKETIEGKFISENQSRYEAKKSAYNNQLKKYSLAFTNKDIEYLFVETKEQLNEIHKITSIDNRKIKISKWLTNI